MKGVSAVIAIILILMIVVALAALAYTWFTGIFSSLTGTAGTAVEATTGQMAYSFSLESAICEVAGCAGADCIHASIRNTGTGTSIDMEKISTYVGGVSRTHTGTAGVTITYGQVDGFDIDDLAIDCTNDVGRALTVTIETGLEQSKTIE